MTILHDHSYKKALIFTDPHVDCRGGSRVFRELQSAYFKEVMFPTAISEGCDVIVCGGDFFDKRNSVSLATIDYITNEFIPLVKETGLPVYVIVGNHDIAFKNTNRINSLSIFKSCDLITVVEDDLAIITTTGKPLVCCPWINPENEERLLSDLKEVAISYNNPNLIGHFEIKGAKLDKSRLCDHGVEADVLSGYSHVMSGHFHLPSRLANIEYLGATFHLNWGDYGSWRGFKTYDFGTDKIQDFENEYCIFTQLSLEEIEMINDAELERSCESMYVKIIVSRETDNLRVRIEEAVHRVEKCMPLKVDVLDLTIFDRDDDINSSSGDNDTESDYVVKTPVEYFKESCDDADAIALFSELYDEVQASIRDQQQ